MVGGGGRFLPEILDQIDQPLKKCRLRIDIRLNHYTERKKVQLSLIGRALST